MCGYTCARSFLFLLSVVFLLVGGGLLGLGLYGQTYELAFNDHFLDQFFDRAKDPALENQLKSRILLYFQVLTGVSIGLGALMFLTGIVALYGACRNFKTMTRYGDTVNAVNSVWIFMYRRFRQVVHTRRNPCFISL